MRDLPYVFLKDCVHTPFKVTWAWCFLEREALEGPFIVFCCFPIGSSMSSFWSVTFYGAEAGKLEPEEGQI